MGPDTERACLAALLRIGLSLWLPFGAYIVLAYHFRANRLVGDITSMGMGLLALALSGVSEIVVHTMRPRSGPLPEPTGELNPELPLTRAQRVALKLMGFARRSAAEGAGFLYGLGIAAAFGALLWVVSATGLWELIIALVLVPAYLAAVFDAVVMLTIPRRRYEDDPAVKRALNPKDTRSFYRFREGAISLLLVVTTLPLLLVAAYYFLK